MLALLLLLTLFKPTSALPIPHSHYPASLPACLVFGVIAILLLILICLKRVFRNRRVSSAQNSRTGSFESVGASVTSQSEKSGFIVGFLGSPTVEILCQLEQTEETKDSSFTSHIHTVSRSPRTDYPSVLDIRRQETHSFKLPSLPSKPHVAQLPPKSRRFSLPVMRSVTHDARRPRHSSLKSARSQRSMTFSPSVRIVNHSPTLHSSPPNSPRLAELANILPTASSTPISPKPGSRLSRSFIPPLPFTHSPPSPVQRSGPLQISHPYALSRKATTPCETENPLSTRQPVRSPEIPASSESPSPPLSSFPAPPLIPSILRSKFKARTRRSPTIGPIGPSPLRTMILPESPITLIPATAGVVRNLSPSESRRASRVMDQDDPSVLFSIIRELVEETSEWDTDSVFMSQNFKELLQTSVKGTNESDESESSDQSRSAGEFDLGSSCADLANLVSFWDESSGERETGVAW
ncbi:hypothetical protein FB45DRAFT_1023597 [Roridomyces roridus]|uniref:Uncharacterized protein n=1 Tax=Roridomyces roridus TaxID=1738132 RepID=A0AAD7C4Z0_9AGAR|nr:hypothetical protein FB45DRAFT_1023597 [Roridomyces roridus]